MGAHCRHRSRAVTHFGAASWRGTGICCAVPHDHHHPTATPSNDQHQATSTDDEASPEDHAHHHPPHDSHDHDHDHDHHHHHHDEQEEAESHGSSGHHHHHHPANGVSRLLRSLGILEFAERLEHSTTCIAASIACFALSLLLAATPVGPALAASVALPPAAAAAAAAWALPRPQDVLLACTFVLSGVPQAADTLVALGSFIIDTHVLMSLAVVGTVVLGMAHEGALLLLLFQLSHMLEEKFTAQAQGSLARLLGSVPTRATTVQMSDGSHRSSGGGGGNGRVQTSGSSGGGGRVQSSGSGGGGSRSSGREGGSSISPLLATACPVLARDVVPGTHVLVKPGEQVPLDGLIVWGTASVSLQHISGESQPVRLTVGQSVPAGSLNTDGLLVVRTTARAEDSTPYRMARMAADAQSAKPRLQSLLDRVGDIWSKAVIAATLLTAVALPLLFDVPLLGPRGALYRAMGVLVAGSPCAVVLVPLAYTCAIAAITRRGVLVKNAAALDSLDSVTHIALDKTGTITSGWLTLTRAYVVAAVGAVSGEPALALVGGTSSSSRSASSASSVLQALAIPSPLGPAPATPASSSSTASAAAADAERRRCSGASAGVSGTDGGTAGGTSDGAHAFSAVALRYAVALSRASNHPVSRAVTDMGDRLRNGSSGVSEEDVSVSDFEQVPGGGVQGVCGVPGHPAQLVRFGSLDFVSGHLPADGGQASQLKAAEAEEQRQPRSGATSFLSAVHLPAGHPLADGGSSVSGNGGGGSGGGASAPADVAMLCFEDVVQRGVSKAVAQLQQGTWRRGGGGGAGSHDAAAAKEVVMLTGDNERVAASVAESVGIRTHCSAMKPEEKLQYVTAFHASPKLGLLMMGDGINDAPALAAARVGVAVAATPSDMVAAAADLIILNGQGVANLPWLLRTARKTQAIIRQNLALALVAMVMATLPTVAGVFPLWLAVTLHEGSTLLVVLNSLRLLLEPQETLMGALWAFLLRRLGMGAKSLAAAGARPADKASLVTAP